MNGNGTETVADVVAEMRRDCDGATEQTSWNKREIGRMADRIEAALVRNNDEYNGELARWRDAFNRLKDAVGHTLDEPILGMCPQSVYGPLCKVLADAIKFQDEIGGAQ